MAKKWLETGEAGAEEGITMSTPAQIGGYEWKASLDTARSVKAEIRRLLLRYIDRPNEATLLVQAVLQLGELDDAINRLEEIGRNTKG